MSRIDFNPNIGAIGKTDSTVGPAPATGKFRDVLKTSFVEVNRLQADAEKAINAVLTGKTDNVAEVMIAAQKADLAFKTLLQIRNKLLDAYNEVRQMRI